MRRHQDVQLHFAGDLRRGSLYRFRLDSGFRRDGRRRGLPEKRGELTSFAVTQLRKKPEAVTPSAATIA
jgi:hypothetical protein